MSVGVKLNHQKAVSLITMLRNKRMIVQETRQEIHVQAGLSLLDRLTCNHFTLFSAGLYIKDKAKRLQRM